MEETKSIQLKWVLNQHVRLLKVQKNQLCFGWLGQRVLLKSSAAEEVARVVEILQAPHTIEQLLAKSAERWTRANLEKLLFALYGKRLVGTLAGASAANERLGENVEPRWRSYLVGLSNSQADIERAQTNLNELRLKIVTRIESPESRQELLSTFAAQWVRPDELTASSIETKDLLIVMANSSDLNFLRALDEVTYSAPSMILPVMLDPFGAIVGPAIGGPGRPCLSCFAKRLSSNLERSDDLESLPNEHFDDVALAWSKSYWRRLGSIVEDEIFKLVSRAFVSGLERGAFRFDFLNHRSAYEEVFPIPGCRCSKRFVIPDSDFELNQ